MLASFMDMKHCPWSGLLTYVLIVCAIIGLTIFAYKGLGGHQFLNFDDDVYVATNNHVKNGFTWEGLKWAFTFTDVSYWQPLALLSHMLDCQLFGVKPGPHLLMNLMFHIVNSLLLFLILRKMTGAEIKAALVALLFALHPLNCDSIAWLAERKTVLSALFFLAAIHTYISYAQGKRNWLFAVTLGLYALGLMSKPAILTFPFLLLVLDYWPLGRLRHYDPYASESKTVSRGHWERLVALCKSNNVSLILEKAPFLVLSLLSASLTMASVMDAHMVVGNRLIPLSLRIYNLFVSIVHYLRNIFWPVELSIFYPFPKTIVLSELFLALLIEASASFLAFKMRKERPWLLAGWCWFLIALAPACGLVQAGLWPAIANRFMYLPLMGILVMLVWEGDERLKGAYSRVLKVILCSALLIFLLSLTHLQNIYYSNSFSLFNRCLSVVGKNELALNNLGQSLATLGRVNEAMQNFAENIKLNPMQATSYSNYGTCLVAKGDDLQAIPYFQKAIALNPRLIVPYIHLGLIQNRRGYKNEAVKIMEKALQIDQNNLEAHNNLGAILAEQGKFSAAASHFLFVLKADPAHVQARLNLASAYEETGLYAEAMVEYETLDKSLTRNKGYVHYRIARLYAQKGMFRECVNYLSAARKENLKVGEYIKTDKKFDGFRASAFSAPFLEDQKKRLSGVE